MPPGLALLPLRLFLGATFVYAGLDKLTDPGFLTAGADTYIGDQLAGFASGTPGGWVLETLALPQPELAGVGVAVAEIGIGLLAFFGRFTRSAAAAGLGLNLLLLLTATWKTAPFYMGSDVVFVFAWLPFVLCGAAGQPALDHGTPRALRLERRGRVPVAVPGDRLTRRAAMARALGVAAGATGVLAGLGVLLRGAPPARAAKLAAGQRVAASADVAPGAALRIVNPLDGGAAFVIRGADGAVSGLGAVCTHAGCDVEWTGEDFRCPCHHARFDAATGEPTRGPAEMPLPRLEVVERGGEIRVV